MPKKTKAKFVEPMLLLRKDELPDDATQWQYELKVDGYRAIAFKTAGKLHLRSRNDNDFATRYPGVLKGLTRLPNETVVDGELVAFDADGKPSFNALQNQASAETPIVYFVFDVMVLAGRDVRQEPLHARRELLERKILPKLSEPARYLHGLEATLPDLIASVKAQGLEGLVAKRRDYVLAAKSGGLSDARILFRHLLPNVVTQAIVFACSDIVLDILAIVTLGYLGLGVQPPNPDWGRMIADGQTFLTTHWELSTIPGIAVVVTALGLSLLADGLADLLRPE